MDARTGLGRFHNFRISNYNLMMALIDHCTHASIDEILQLPDVKERVELYRKHETLFKEQIQRCGKVYQNLVLLDLTEEETIYAGNRFIIYALYPQCNISIHKMWGFQKQNIVFATGKSIFDRSSRTNIGELMLKYGGVDTLPQVPARSRLKMRIASKSLDHPDQCGWLNLIQRK